MSRVVPPLHDRHASIGLQDAFLDAVDAFEDWQPGQQEPTVAFEGKDVPISSIFGRLRTSEDLMPEKTKLAVASVLSEWDAAAATYSDAATRLREGALERLKAGESGK